MKRPHEDKITFSLAYRTQFFHTSCAKLDLAHAVLLERAQSDTLRTECEKKSSLYDVNTYLNVKFAFTAYSHILLKNVKIKAQTLVLD